MTTEKYNLQDIELLNTDAEFSFIIWVPDSTYIILGAGDSEESSVHIDLALTDNVKVLKRPSGGHSVVLSSNMIIISAVCIDAQKSNPKILFEKYNNVIIESLESFGIEYLHSKGISDVSIGEKKILGSSIYRSKNKVLYHAVLNYNGDINLIEKYLKHPKREPDYRNGRAHKEFVTSIVGEGYNLSMTEIIKRLEMDFEKLK